MGTGAVRAEEVACLTEVAEWLTSGGRRGPVQVADGGRVVANRGGCGLVLLTCGERTGDCGDMAYRWREGKGRRRGGVAKGRYVSCGAMGDARWDKMSANADEYGGEGDQIEGGVWLNA